MDVLHVNVGLETHEALVRAERHRHVWVRSLRRFFEDVDLLAAALPDTHGHLLVGGSRGDLGQRVHALECWLSWHLELTAGFRPAYFREVEDQRHLARAFDYVLSNGARHGSSSDPLQATTNLPDLLGAREELAFTRPVVRSRLPRIGRDHLLGLLEVKPGEGRDPRQVVDAAEAAAVASVGEQGRGARQAARVAAALGLELGVPRAELAGRLRTRAGDLARLGRRADPALLRAARVQLRWLDGAR